MTVLSIIYEVIIFYINFIRTNSYYRNQMNLYHNGYIIKVKLKHQYSNKRIHNFNSGYWILIELTNSFINGV